MSDPLANDPYARRAQMFPTLSPAQLARAAAHGRARRVRAGEIVWEQGDAEVPFFLVMSGSLAILHPTADGEETVTVHHAGEFTGEVDMLSGRRALVRGRALSELSLVALDRAELHRLVQTDAELSELFLRAFILRRMGLIAHAQGDLVLVGSSHSAATLRLQEFLTRNGHPYAYMDVERDPGVQALLDAFHVTVDAVPVVVLRGTSVLKSPSVEALAKALGMDVALDPQRVYDLVVVGAGPAGLAAAVYAASEGLGVLVLEGSAPGGQAGSSSKIENYLGFPTGISGQALSARAFTQAEKFGAEIAIARSAVRLHCDRRPYEVELAGGERVRARAIVIATGAEYRKPALPNRERFEGAGVYYGATYLEAQRCERSEVIVVGGGNSAGQAAVFLARSSSRVHVLVRGAGLAASMSRYLIRRIEETPNITLRTHAEIVALEGAAHLERVTVAQGPERSVHEIRHVFLMTGASPNTRWLDGCLALDDKGFVKTGLDLDPATLAQAGWPLARGPQLLETSLPGVFAVGDARANNVKRVASAVGEGSICVSLVHTFLAE